MSGTQNKLTAQILVQEVRANILSFWQNMMDNEYGGFYGEADFNGKINKTAVKGGVLNSRILWTFSEAYRLFKDDIYKDCAARARDFLLKAFYDNEYGGVFWHVDYKGRLPETGQGSRKQFYNIAFAVYALSGHYLAFLENSSLESAMELFSVIEKYGLDPVSGGYIEARTRSWKNTGDFRLSDKDLNCPKSMNTNLHVLEAYTSLLKAGGDERVKNALKDLLRIMLDKIVSSAHHYKLFFDMNWNSLSNEISYGHDIEGSWLMYEAAAAIGDEKIIYEVKQTAAAIADAVYKTAVDRTAKAVCKNGKPEDGGLISGCDEDGKIRVKKEWWPQAEAVIGFYNAYELTGDQKYYEAANSIWSYIQKYFTDNVNGEWHNELSADNTPDTNMPKAGFWKCPYHNARACFELIRRV